MSDDPLDIRDITPAEAVDEHEAGDVHCAMPAQWESIAHLFDVAADPWLKGKIGRITIPDVSPGLFMVCVDTTGLKPEQTNVVLSRFYGADSSTTGVAVVENERLAEAITTARDRARRRGGR